MSSPPALVLHQFGHYLARSADLHLHLLQSVENQLRKLPTLAPARLLQVFHRGPKEGQCLLLQGLFRHLFGAVDTGKFEY